VPIRIKLGLRNVHWMARYCKNFPWLVLGPSWSWSYGSWIYNYLWNQFLSPLKLWVRTLFMARHTRYNIMW
jgi:hypothetical protein